MRRYLIDTGALSLILSGDVPEKWRRHWDDIKFGEAQMILIEPLVCEVYYKNVPQRGKRGTLDRILWLKSLPQITIYEPDDNDALFAGDLKLRHPSALSIVDCFILAATRSTRARLITTDHSMRDAARRVGLRVDWLPYS